MRPRILGVIILLVGMWVFLAPVIGPLIHLYYTPPPMEMGGMNASGATINQAMVIFNFLPGVVLILLGIYLLFSGRTSPVTY
jgi:hypothetical protein